MFRKYFYKVSFLFLIIINSAFAEITYNDILDNPTDLELNLNFAKQQEKAGNIKLTISTLERLSMLYPSNSEIKLYLLSIVIKMDSPAKLTLLVQSIISDPNTNTDTKKLISELLDSEGKLAEPSKWFAYLDLSYSQTENSNYDSVPVSKQRLVTDNLQPFATNKTIEYDKSYKRSSALTFGKNIDDTSSVFFNLGLDLNTLNKKEIGESDLINGSISYFKIIGDHYITPYAYYNRANYRGAADANMKGLGLNNTYILGEKNNINYTIGYSNTEYHTTAAFTDKHLENNDIYSFGLKLNHNISNKNKFGIKLLHNIASAKNNHYSNDTSGIELSYAHALTFGTINLSSRLTEKKYREKNSAVSTTIDREDEGIVNRISLKGQLSQILPKNKIITTKKDFFYDINFSDFDTKSNISTNEVKKQTLTFGLTKRINFNGLFNK